MQERIHSYFDLNPELRLRFIFNRMSGNETELSKVNWQEYYKYKCFDENGSILNCELA